jgi:hypothetical protein
VDRRQFLSTAGSSGTIIIYLCVNVTLSMCVYVYVCVCVCAYVCAEEWKERYLFERDLRKILDPPLDEGHLYF